MARVEEGDGMGSCFVLRSAGVLQKETEVSCQLREGMRLDSSQTCSSICAHCGRTIAASIMCPGTWCSSLGFFLT